MYSPSRFGEGPRASLSRAKFSCDRDRPRLGNDLLIFWYLRIRIYEEQTDFLDVC